MMSLFNSFDLNFFVFCVIWMSTLFLMLSNLYFKFSVFNYIILKVINTMTSFFLSIKSKSSNSMTSLVICLMFVVVMFNFSSILSFNFPMTSQVSLIFFLSTSIWLMIVAYYLLNNLMGFMAHCIPEGTPLYLTFVLFAIELVSNLIRPITLMVRLVANILAGHLLMILMSKLSLNNLFMLMPYAGLNLVEIFVSFIQAYIFVTMIYLYYSDLN